MIYILVNGEIKGEFQDELFPNTVISIDASPCGSKAEDLRLFDHKNHRMFRLTKFKGALPDQYKLLADDGIPDDIEYKIWEFDHPNQKVSAEDVVNHPTHYETGKFECIDVMLETQGKQAVTDFCVCNAFKYLYRHGRKNGVEDLKKARWYLDKAIGLIEGDDDE